eukprot:1158174-Pyramimonas_sp.AAC.1
MQDGWYCRPYLNHQRRVPVTVHRHRACPEREGKQGYPGALLEVKDLLVAPRASPVLFPVSNCVGTGRRKRRMRRRRRKR